MNNKCFIYIVLGLLLASCINNPSDYTKKLSGYIFYSEGPNDNVIIKKSAKEGDPEIYCNVISYNYNDHFILAAQKPAPDCFLGEVKGNHLGKSSIQFWILDVTKNNLYGPYDKTTYLQQKKALNVPYKLKLKQE